MRQKLNIAIGRFQPFTQGHLNMINEGDAPCIVYRINSSNKEIERKRNGIKIGSKSYTNDTVNHVIEYIDNPTGDLTEQEKELLKRPFTNELIDKEFDIVKKSNKNIVDIVPVVHVYDALGRYNAFLTEHSDEYEVGDWMCGDDRKEAYEENAEKLSNYDELETELKSGKTLPNILVGKLKVNTGKGRTEGVSGTAVRKSILSKDKASFEKIMPKGTGSLFNDFVQSFVEFKDKLKNIINEHKMMTLKDYIIESIESMNENESSSLVNDIIDSVLSRWSPNKRHQTWISNVEDKLNMIYDNIEQYKKDYHITSSTKYSEMKDIAHKMFEDLMGKPYKKDNSNNYTEDELLFACLCEMIGMLNK